MVGYLNLDFEENKMELTKVEAFTVVDWGIQVDWECPKCGAVRTETIWNRETTELETDCVECGLEILLTWEL